MLFNLMTTTSLSLLLFLSTSIQPAFALTQPTDVTGDERYSLTLMSNPTIILVSDDSGGTDRLKVDIFNATESWSAADVGPDNSRRWNMYDGLQSLHNVHSNGYLYFKDFSLNTDGQVYPTNDTHIALVASTGIQGGGIKIAIVVAGEEKAWVDERASITASSKKAAVWAITKVGKLRGRMMRRSTSVTA